MSSSQYTEWFDFYCQEPFGAWWDNWLMAKPLQFFRQLHAKKGHQPDPAQLFYKDKLKKQREADQSLQAMFQSKAKKKGK